MSKILVPLDESIKMAIVQHALLKARRLEKENDELKKVLKIIKVKRVDMWHLVDLLEQDYEMYLAFCKSEKYKKDYILTKKEMNLLKRRLGNE